MLSPKINTKVINVELTNERNKQLITHITPVMRLLNGGRGAVCDVVIRKVQRPWGGHVYSILVRLQAGDETYYAVAHERYFVRGVKQATANLRRTMSKSYYAQAQEVRTLQQVVHEKYFVELFV